MVAEKEKRKRGEEGADQNRRINGWRYECTSLYLGPQIADPDNLASYITLSVYQCTASIDLFPGQYKDGISRRSRRLAPSVVVVVLKFGTFTDKTIFLARYCP